VPHWQVKKPLSKEPYFVRPPCWIFLLIDLVRFVHRVDHDRKPRSVAIPGVKIRWQSPEIMPKIFFTSPKVAHCAMAPVWHIETAWWIKVPLQRQ
jgi:hypothetical protein